jgi:S-formylglutathione hydrolase FrmB
MVGTMSWLPNLSLMAPAVGWGLGAILVALLVWLLARRLWPRRLVAAVMAAVLVVFLGRHVLPASVDVARIPFRFYLWIVVLLTVAGVLAGHWQRLAGRRLVGGFAVAVACLLGAQQANAWFAYYPTVGDLLGSPLPDQVSLAQLRAGEVSSDQYPHGALVSIDLASTGSGFHHRSAMVWLPPSALGLPPSALGVATGAALLAEGSGHPVVMLLAGTPGRPEDMVRSADFAAVAARYGANHDGAAPLLVMPDHNGGFLADSECVGTDGQAERYLTQDVPSAMHQLFGVSASQWGVVGYSEGGTCALVLSLRHPDLFPVFVDIGGDDHPNLGSTPARDLVAQRLFYAGDTVAANQHDPRYLLAHGHFDGLHGWFVSGQADRPALRTVNALAPAARQAGIDVRETSPPGHHSFSLVNAVSDEVLSWVVSQLPPRVALI